MRFFVVGADHETGERVEMTVEAADGQAAAGVASRRNVRVLSIQPAPVTVAVPPGARTPAPTPPQPTQGRSVARPASKPPRVWLGLGLLVLPIGAPFVPDLPLWTGVALASLVALYSIAPPLRRGLRTVFRVSPERPVRGGLKLAILLLYGGVLVLAGMGGRSVRAEMAAAEQRRGTERTEQARRIAAANEQVQSLVAQATQRLDAGEIEGAVRLVEQARGIEHATNRAQAASLARKISQSGDAAHIMDLLVSMSDEEFSQFGDGGTVTASLDFGVPALTERAIQSAKSQIAAAAQAREERRRQALAEAEAQRQRELAEAEAKRKAEEEKAAAERARREAAQREVKEKLDAYIALLNRAEVSIVERVSVQRIGDDIWEATITVRNLWHIRAYQLRLQDAQTLWEAWAGIASPRDPDKARIKIVDLRENEVGGSRIWGGSLIWVQEK